MGLEEWLEVFDRVEANVEVVKYQVLKSLINAVGNYAENDDGTINLDALTNEENDVYKNVTTDFVKGVQTFAGKYFGINGDDWKEVPEKCIAIEGAIYGLSSMQMVEVLREGLMSHTGNDNRPQVLDPVYVTVSQVVQQHKENRMYPALAGYLGETEDVKNAFIGTVGLNTDEHQGCVSFADLGAQEMNHALIEFRKKNVLDATYLKKATWYNTQGAKPAQGGRN